MEGRSDSSGNLVIPSMVPGIINFNVDAKGYTRWWSDAAAKEFERQPQVQNGQFQWNFGNIDFEITDGTPAAKFVVEREVTLRGKVVDPDGLPVKGATIGGIVFDLQVVRVDGRPLDWATAIVRALSCFLSLFIFGLGFIWIAVDHERQAWHDKIAGTVVVRLPKGVSLV